MNEETEFLVIIRIAFVQGSVCLIHNVTKHFIMQSTEKDTV